MPTRAQAPPAVPRLTYLRIKNYRALRDVEFRDLTPLSVFIGPNGSGKSTVLDALAFLAEAVSGNLTQAWGNRNRFAGMRTRGSDGNIEFELEIKPSIRGKSIKYQLAVQEVETRIIVAKEDISIESGKGRYKNFFSARYGIGSGSIGLGNHGINDENSIADFSAQHQKILASRDISSTQVAVKYLSIQDNQARTLATHIVEIITSYRYINLTDDHRKDFSDEGPRERLSPNGDNLPNVLYYLHLKHPETLAKITAQVQRWVPGLAEIVPEITSDERLLLSFKDAPFEKPLRAKYMSGGTMRLAALLTLLYEPGAAGLLGIEEPENELHPQLLPALAEELLDAAEHRQLLIATHSPALLNALEPEQVWVLHRGADGYTQATRAADLPGISAMVEEGSPLGYLWSRNFFDVGNPLASSPPVREADAS